MKKAFLNYLKQKDYSELRPLWNEYAGEQSPDDQIYDGVEEYCDLYDPKAVDVARMVAFGDIKNWGDDVYLNGYGNFKSCWSVESSPIDLEVLAEWLNDSYNRAELIAMWEEYTGEEIDDFDLGVLAESIEEADGDEYQEYLKSVYE